MVLLFSLKLMSIALCMPDYELMRKENNQLRYLSETIPEVMGFFFIRFQQLVPFYFNFQINGSKRNYKGGNVILKRKNLIISEMDAILGFFCFLFFINFQFDSLKKKNSIKRVIIV